MKALIERIFLILTLLFLSNGSLFPKDSNDFNIGLEIMEKASCTRCHSLFDKRRIVGPSLKGIYNTDRYLVNGDRALADVQYLKNAITKKNREIVNGYSGNFHPEYSFTEKELNLIITVIKEL